MTRSRPTDTYDVAIVGYGPTGMTLAALLGDQGHRVVVLDRHAGLYNLPRAACFDDEIMRIFQKLGLVDEVMPGTVVQSDYDWVNAKGETLMEMSYDNPARAGWAALYMMYQPHIETVLDRRCQALPSVEVRQGVRVDGLEQTAEGVEVSGTDHQGHRSHVQARYLVGADGGAGFVRPALGIGFSDYGFQENWLVCDFRKRRDLPLVPTFRQVCDPSQPVSIVRIGPDHQRFSFMLDRDETGASAIDEGRVWARVAPYLGPDDAELVRVANYVFRSRVSDRWRHGAVMLAGDSAHEMPPFLAQGMCSGMRDSHNLAWKLDLILNGHAESALLDTYQPEREPHVRFITEKAIELGRVQTLRDPDAARERDERLLAARRERDVPDRLVYPGLTAGLVSRGSPHAGEFFPQAWVRPGAGSSARFDDVVGPGPAIVVGRTALLSSLADGQLEWWHSLGGRAVALVADATVNGDGVPGVTKVVDGAGNYGSWFQAHACDAAVVRPDWYLYGTAAGGPQLAELVVEMERGLRPTSAADAQPVVLRSSQ